MIQHVQLEQDDDDQSLLDRNKEIERLIEQARELAWKLSEEEKPIHSTWEELCEIVQDW